MLVVWVFAAGACLLNIAAAPRMGVSGGPGQAVVELVRVAAATGLAITLVLGPGLLWRALSDRCIGLGFLALPGLAILATAGGLAWALGGSVEPRVTCFAVVGPVLGLLLGGILAAGPEDLLDSAERRVLLVVGGALGFAISRAIWSGGPDGELYHGTISRTLEVGDRSDARISFNVVQLITFHTAPFSGVGGYYFAPYNFSSRGPLPGFASAPVIFAGGGKPPLYFPEEPWQPYDPAGYMAYRLAMMTFACTAFLALWELTRRIAGNRAAQVAVLLAATTPFLVHEIWFTWPKMLAATFVILAGVCVLSKRPFSAGLLLGIGYLCHPGALVWISALALLTLWPIAGANWRRPQVKALVLLLVGTSLSLIAWRLANGSHYNQSGFIEYFGFAGTNYSPGALEWLAYRAASVGNTLVPLVLPIFFSNSVSINVFGGTSPPAIHFFFEYWDSLPFGFAIVFFPFLLVSLWRALKRWTWPVLASIVIPFVAFSIYWGSSDSGMMREGLQAWALVLCAVIAIQQRAAGYAWFRSKLVRVVLVLRVAEVLLVAVGPALATNHILISSGFTFNDIAAVTAMLGFSALLGYLVWSTTTDSLAQLDDGAPVRAEADG